MFERYTEKARRVIFFARYEASQFGASAIEAEHILLGLLREDKGLVNRFFPRPDGLIESIHKEVEGRTVVREKISTSVDLPLSPIAKRALGHAQQESDMLRHRYIGTEHLLLGLLREEKSLAAEILRGHGLQIEQVREELKQATNVAPAPPSLGTGSIGTGTIGAVAGGIPSTNLPGPLKDLVEVTLFNSAFGHWTEAARQALFLARCEAGGYGSRTVAPEHLLLGLLRVDEAPAVASIARLRDVYAELQAEIEEGRGETDPFPLMFRAPLTSATLRAIADAQDTQERLGRKWLEVEHLLLGLLLEGGERVVALAAAHGISADAVRAEIDALGNGDDA